MKKPGLVLLGLLMFETAIAQPAPGFTKETSFESCTTSWAFACGKRDAQGRTFGTAHPRKQCSRYTFRPDGTFTSLDMIPGRGTYRLIGSTVRISPIEPDGTAGKSFDLVLTPDGSQLGNLKRL